MPTPREPLAAWSDGLDEEDIEIMQLDANEGRPAALPWNEKTAPDRVRPRECVRAARDALNRAYLIKERAAVPLLIEALDWLRRALEQMSPGDAE